MKKAKSDKMLPMPEKPKPVEKDPVYTVPKGMTITCRKGRLPEGTIVKPKDFADGQNTIDDLVDRGLLLKG